MNEFYDIPLHRGMRGWVLTMKIHDRFPSVTHLAVHLENGQRIYFTEQDVVDKVINPKKTFFEL